MITVLFEDGRKLTFESQVQFRTWCDCYNWVLKGHSLYSTHNGERASLL